MGINSSLHLIQTHFPSYLHKWTKKQRNNYEMGQTNPCIVIDQIDHIVGQKYTVIQFQSLQYELEMFLFRKENPQSLVAVHDILLKDDSPSIFPDCVTNQHHKKFQVILERIPYRLVDIGVIRFQQMIYIIQKCFKALQILWIHYGKTFYVDEDLICFNSQGKCKFWINQNLSKNNPNIQAVFLQETIIKSAFQLLQSRLNCSLPQSYSRLKQSTQLNKFSQAIAFIQKTKKKFSIQLDCLQNLKKQEKQYFSDSSEEIKVQKLSLKYSRKMNFSRLKKTQTLFSKEQTTDISSSENYRQNTFSQSDEQKLMRSTHKSINTKQKKKVNYTQYSQKGKRRLSLKKQNEQNPDASLNLIKVNLNFN